MKRFNIVGDHFVLLDENRDAQSNQKICRDGINIFTKIALLIAMIIE